MDKIIIAILVGGFLTEMVFSPRIDFTGKNLFISYYERDRRLKIKIF